MEVFAFKTSWFFSVCMKISEKKSESKTNISQILNTISSGGKKNKSWVWFPVRLLSFTWDNVAFKSGERTSFTDNLCSLELVLRHCLFLTPVNAVSPPAVITTKTACSFFQRKTIVRSCLLGSRPMTADKTKAALRKKLAFRVTREISHFSALGNKKQNRQKCMCNKRQYVLTASIISDRKPRKPIPLFSSLFCSPPSAIPFNHRWKPLKCSWIIC